MAVEMLVDRNVQDDLGQKAELQYTRLRYELEVTSKTDEFGLERLYIRHESLNAIPREQDSWYKKHGLLSQNNRLPSIDEQATFISTELTTTAILRSSDGLEEEAKNLMIHLYREGEKTKRLFSTEVVQRTVLSSVNIIEFPHAFATREEMRSWRFLHLSHQALHQPSLIGAPSLLSSDGSNLPTVLARMQAEDEFALADVSRDMANLVPGILKIRVEKNQARNEYEIWANTSDQRSFSSQVLSDGTLRLLALATMKNDSQFHGVLCLEEPENGIEPLHLKNMARIMLEMATDFKDPQQEDEPLRQILITTHSPAFISLPEVIDSLLLAVTPTRVGDSTFPSLRVTRMIPVLTPGNEEQLETDSERDNAGEVYTIDMVRKYLSSNNLDNAEDQLKKARAILLKKDRAS
jgi:predicted ATPase